MFRIPANVLRAAAIAIPALLATSVALPATAQISISIGYNDFHSRLSPYGTWINDPRWGQVWHPTRVSRNFRPYYDGHWVNTREYGWLWVSNERFGDVTYHYGRWVLDQRRGWLWVPGYVWAPSWVIWRSGGGNVAWFPMPPGDNYYGQGVYGGNFQNRYGYDDWYGPSFDNNRFLSLWIVVGQDHFADSNYRNYVKSPRNYANFASQTRDYTNYSTVNNYVVNRSIDSALPKRAADPRFQPVPASRVIGSNALVTPMTVGRQVEQRERQQQPATAQQRAPVAAAPARNQGNGRGNAPIAAAPQRAPATAAPAENPGGRGRDNAPAAFAPAAAPRQRPAAAAPTENRGNRGRDNAPAAAAPPLAAAPQQAPAAAAPADNRGGRGRDSAPAAAAPAAAPNERGGNRGRGNNPAAAPATDSKPADDKAKNDNAGNKPRRGN